MQDMAWCQAYAFQNRKHMLDLMVDSVNAVTGALPDLKNSVNIHHNYCQCERCEYTVSTSQIHSKQTTAISEMIQSMVWALCKQAADMCTCMCVSMAYELECLS